MRLNESARPPRPERAELCKAYWDAPTEALLDRKTVAAGLSRSLGWLEQFATKGAATPSLGWVPIASCIANPTLWRGSTPTPSA